MADKDQILKEKMEHIGLFDFKGFYSFAHAWFKEDKYGVTEEKYSEKTSGNSRDILIEWRATKDLSDYFKFEFKIRFEIEGMTEVEVEIDGQKKTANKGKIKTEITGTLISDKDSKWDTSPFARFSRDLYNKYIIPSRMEDMKDLLRSKVQTFKDELKAFLDLIGRR
ncbi:MAG: hypothetical protein ABIH92_00055 [Nanoarchaeota archaeon]